MPRFDCPNCGGAVKAPAEKQGVSGICPRCRQWLTVPDDDAAVAIDDGSDDLEATEATEQPARREGKGPSSSAGTAVGGGGLVLLGIAAWIFYKTGLWKRLLVDPLAGLLEAQGVPAAPVVAALIVLAVVVIALATLVCLWLKSMLNAQLPLHLEFLIADPKKFPKLDQQALDRYTQAFQSLGFRNVRDYSTKTEIPSPNKGFGRLFVHAKHRCFAEANQVMPAGVGEGAPMRCTVMSFLDDGWSLSSGTRDPASVKTMWLWRRPRSLWTCHPGEPPARVVKAHLEQRQEMIDVLGIEPLSDVSPEAYFEHEQDAAVQRKRAFQRKNIMINLIQLWLFGKNPRYEWLGEFAKLARRREE